MANLAIKKNYVEGLFGFLIISLFILSTEAFICSRDFYDPVPDCLVHPLKLGYYAGGTCGSLHTLTDADDRPNPNLARLNHPSSYQTATGTQYVEYSAGRYLSIKFSKQAQVHGIALQGSPNDLRYYLLSFELWYKTTIRNLDITKPATTIEGFYKEDGATKRFSGQMGNTKKFHFSAPFYADEVRIYPILFHGDKVFRTELYGCYLGRVNVPSNIIMGKTTTISLTKVQNAISSDNQYYFKVNEPDGNSSLISTIQTADYTFKSGGQGSVELGLQYSTGWLMTDQISFKVTGPIIDLELLLDGTTKGPYTQADNLYTEFRLRTFVQPYQIKTYLFAFGDSTTCTYNYCKKKYLPGVYNVTGTASNSDFQSSVQRTIVSCPTSASLVTYTPAVHAEGIGIRYLGPTITHKITIQFYALWSTTYDAWLNNIKIQSESLSFLGLSTRQISLPTGLARPSQNSLKFNYTDSCGMKSYSATVYMDEKVEGLSLRLHQVFKNQLILQVPYFFKNHPVTAYIDVENGTSVQCKVSIAKTSGTTYLYSAVQIANKTFAYNHTFASPGDTTHFVGGRCWNRLNLPVVVLPGSGIDVKEIPEQMTNYSLELSKAIVTTSESFFLYIIFLKGNQINCSISSPSAGISQDLTYNQLIVYQQAYSNGRKAYRLTVSTNVFSLEHRIVAVCRNVWKEVRENVTFQAQIPILSGIAISASGLVCYGVQISIISTLSQGAPIHKSLYVDNQKKLDYYSVNVTDNTFGVTSDDYGFPGWKNIYVRAWNDVSSQTSASKIVRVARTVENLDLGINFTLTSLQALLTYPNFVLPAKKQIKFTAIVNPVASGYYYRWSISGAVTEITSNQWFYTFPAPGVYSFKLVVDGCNNKTYEKNLTVVSPIENYNVYFSPSPEVVVNKSVDVYITNAKQSKCLKLDFGDGTSPMTHCKTDVSSSDLNCFTDGSVCRVQHVYSKRGNFTIKVTASNGLYAKVKEALLVAKTCYDPLISATGSGTDVTEAPWSPAVSSLAQFKRSVPLLYNLTSVSLNCEFSTTYSITWKVYSYNVNTDPNGTASWNDPSFLRPNSAFTLSQNNHALSIPCCIVSYRRLSVKIEVNMTGHGNALSFSARKVFQAAITQTDLIATLNEVNHKIYPYNMTVSFNASQSSDPDQFSTSLEYIWYCRDTVLESRDISAITGISLVNASQFNSSQSVVGCFGKPVGRIDVDASSSVLEFNSRNLQENHTLEFTLVVQESSPFGVRKSNTSQTLLVLTKETPVFTLSCSENCARKMNPSLKLLVSVNCFGEACLAGPAFKWTLQMNNYTENTTVSIPQLLHSKDTDKNLQMKPNVLLPDMNYTLHLGATGDLAAHYKQSYSFMTNSAPKNGSCFIHPQEGATRFSSLSVSCSGWIDTDLPLSYELSHVSDYFTTPLCNSQASGSCRSWFPADVIDSKTNMTIRIRIVDSISMFKEINFTILSNASRCDSFLYDAVSDCSSHPLRIGYYALPECGSLHMLSDSNGSPYVDYARLDHPAIWGSGYYEYKAGTYLSIKLSKQAHIHAIAVQGSPDDLRYYLKSFELWRETTIYSLVVNTPPSASSGYYKESGITKRFQADMRISTKFLLVNPFYAEEVRIYPITAHVENVFRVELYGCYLGKVIVPETVGMNNITSVTFKSAQNVNNTGINAYFYRITEPDGNATLLTANQSTQYTFKSRGIGIVELGMSYSGGWLKTDRMECLVQGPILGLQMSLNGLNVVPFKSMEFTEMIFKLQTLDQPYQIKRFSFAFGDSSSCSLNNCKKNYSRGFYTATGTALNDFFQASVQTQVIACPNSSVDISYVPSIHLGGIGIIYLGPLVVHNFTIRFYALWKTSYNVTFDGKGILNGSLIGSGWTEVNVSLPEGLTAPSQHNLILNYTDACESRWYTAKIYVDQKITDISLKLNQTFKDQLKEIVPYFFKNKSLAMILHVGSGTTVKCNLSIAVSSNSSANWYQTAITDTNKFAYCQTFTSSGDSTLMVGGKCWNRLNVPEAVLVPAAVDVKQIPDKMRNFSLAVSKHNVTVSEPFHLDLIFLTGELIICNVSYNSSGLTYRFDTNSLLAVQIPYSNSRKAYRLTMPPNSLRSELKMEVTCYNIWGRLQRNITIQVSPVPITGLSMSTGGFACFNVMFPVSSSLSSGAPVYKSLFIDSVKLDDYFSYNGTSSVFNVTGAMVSTPGWKKITVESWNGISPERNVSKIVRIAMKVDNLNVTTSFSLSSPQALSRRPVFVIPALERVDFTAVVTPNASGYLYNWDVNGTYGQTEAPDWSHTFSAPGVYRFKLVVDGCNNSTYDKNLTVVSPIENYNVYFSPSPEVVVNKSVDVYITNAKQSECLKLDFGDGTSPMTHCKTDVSSSDLNCFTDGSVCRVQHVYSKRGNFTIKVTASNGLYAKIKEVLLLAKTCYDPIIHIEGDGTHMAQLIAEGNSSNHIVRKQRSTALFYNITSVDVNCEFSQTYSISWSIFSAGLASSKSNNSLTMWNDPSFLMPNITLAYGRNNHTARIPCCTVKYGLLSISVKVSMNGHNNTAGFASEIAMSTYISETDLVASLKEKNHTDYQYNTTITLNGEDSYDPDKYSLDLNYTWYCRDAALEPRDISTISNLPLISVSEAESNSSGSLNLSSSLSNSLTNVSSNVSNLYVNTKPLIGCFGEPAGILNFGPKSKSVSFNSMNLQENHKIELTLVVTGANPFGVRKGNTSRTVLVRLRETPFFVIRCSENCASKVDQTAKFSLLIDCKGGACSKNTAVFKWTLVMHNSSGSLPVFLNRTLYTRDTDKDMHMKPNALIQGRSYTLYLVAFAPDGTNYKQKYEFATNIAPRNGSCVVDPKQGVAVFSIFHINCTGWIDTELPMTYEVAHLTDLLTTVVCRQTHGSCQTILPVGENGNSSLRIRIRIYDSLRMFTEIYHTIQVKVPAASTSAMSSLLTNIKNAAVSLESAQLIGAVSSILNANETKPIEFLDTSIQIRDASINLLSRMVNSSSDDVIAPLIAILAMLPNEFTQSSANIGTTATLTMTSNLVKNQTSVIFRDLISRSKSLLAAMGMVMKSTSVNLDPNRINKNETNVTENPLKWMTADGRLIVVNNSVAVESLIKTVFIRMSPVETPVHILTQNLGMKLEKKAGTQINGTTNISIMDGLIVLPSLEDMKVKTDLIVESMMKVTTFNSFFWAPTSNVINSSVVEYNLRADNSILGVKDTLKPIQLFIPRTLPTPLKFQHWLFQERENEKRVNYHKLKVENDNSFHIEFKPMNYCSNFQIYIKYNSRPSKSDYNRNWTLPDLSSCNQTGLQDVIRANICSIYQELVDSSLRYQYNGSKTNFNCSLKALLETKVKQITSQCSLDPYRVFMSDSETRNGTYFVGVFDNEGPISTQFAPVELFNDSRNCQVADYVGETSYYVRSYTAKCRYWQGSSLENWQYQGCKVGEMTNESTIHCKCNHLTSFASDFLIAPNPIDMDKVIAGFKNFGDNVSVLVALCLLCAFYIYLVVVLRKVDRKDADKVGVVVIDDDHSKPYEYLVITVTGARTNAGTTANVFCSLNTETKSGEPRLLYDPEKQAFQRDQINAFRIAFEEPIGDITDLRIWHDNHGESPSWYLSHIYVEELQTDTRYSFICEQWLATELEDGLIDRTIPLAGDDRNNFSHIFTTKTAKDFSDQHLWLSVLLKRPHDSFTRVQRVTCCVTVLCTTMLTSAMFFQLGNNTQYLWKIGSLVIDFKGIIIGIQSAFIILPINGSIIAIFRNSESFATYKGRRQTKNLDGSKVKRKTLLPCGFKIVAWFLAIAAIVSSLVIVLFYSMQWGNIKSQQFLLAVFTGFFQSAFIIQPVKLIVVAVLLASIIKKNKEENDALDMYKYSTNKRTVDQSVQKLLVSKIKAGPLTKDQLKYARKRRLMEVRLRLFVQDLISYLIFLTFLVFVVRGYRDPDAYNFSKALTDDVIHEHFQHIQDIPGLWSWVQNHFIPAVYSQTWYNGDNFTNYKMLRNQEAFRIGLSRMRQLRIKPNTCKLDEDVIGLVRGCNDYYSLTLNEERDFDVAWQPLATARKKRSVLDDHDDLRWKSLQEDDVMTKMHSGIDDVSFESILRTDDVNSNERETLLEQDNASQEMTVKAGTDELSTDAYYTVKHGPSLINRGINEFSGLYKSRLDEHLEILRRERRAIKFKVKRKTIPSASLKAHSNVIDIDSQYLLPNGLVRPNKDHWKYNDASKLRGFPYYGKFALYSGGGYVASLATEIDYARAVAMALEQDSWIDTLTRAVFFEFSVYNANLNFFATGFIIVEVLPTGAIVPSPSVRVFRLYRYVGTFGKLVMASEIILVLALFYFIYKECRHLYRIGVVYFKQFWSWVEITIAVALFAALILRGFSWYEADKILTLLKKDNNKYINFHYTVVADDSLLLAVTIISFASTVKILKIISIFPTVVVLKETLLRCAKPLVNYALPFGVLFCAFSIFGNLLFFNSDLFNTYVKSLETQFMMLIGGSVYHTLNETDPVYGPLFFLLFAAFETFIFMNVFVAIINDSIADSAEWKADARSTEFVEYIEERAILIVHTVSSALQAVALQASSVLLTKDNAFARKQRKGSYTSVDRTTGRSHFEIIKEESLVHGKLSLILENFDWTIDKLEKRVNNSVHLAEKDDEEMLKLINEIQRTKKAKDSQEASDSTV